MNRPPLPAPAPAVPFPRDDPPAVIAFRDLVAARADGDYPAATDARKQLRILGYSVMPIRPRDRNQV